MVILLSQSKELSQSKLPIRIARELRAEAAGVPEVKPDVLDSLLDRREFVAVLYHDKTNPEDAKVGKQVSHWHYRPLKPITGEAASVGT